MRIALFVPSWPAGTSANGIVTYASQLVHALRHLGHDVFVIAAHTNTEDEAPYVINLQRFISPFKFRDKALFRLAPATAAFNTVSSAITTVIRELVSKHELEVFEMEESFGWSYAISRLNIAPVVVRLHGPWFLNGRFNDHGDTIASNRHRQKWEGRGILNAHFVTAPSKEVLQVVKDRYDLSLARSRVIPNPLDAVVEEKVWSIETCDTDLLLFVGRFDRRKGGDFILRVFARLCPMYPNLKLIFVGPDVGIVDSNAILLKFETFVSAYFPAEYRSRVEFRGPLGHADVMALRTKAFCTIIASQYEIMPYSVLEGMSLGCPMVVTAVGGIPEMINDHKNGLLVPSQDEDAMIFACKRLLDDFTLAARLGRQAWCDCRVHYSSENIAKQTIAAYQDAVDALKVRKLN